MGLISAVREDFALGTPLPSKIYDPDGNILVEEGAVLETEAQVEGLLARNPLRELSWNSAADALQAEGGAIASQDLSEAVADSRKSGFTFEDTMLRAGDRIQLEPPPTVSQDRYVVQLIGYLERRSLLVTTPVENGSPLPFEENDLVVARIFTGQKAFGFHSVVLRVCKSPYHYLHLSYPDSVQGAIIRKSPRVRTNIITSIAKSETGDSNESKSGAIVDLSVDGACVRTRQRLWAKGETIQLLFRLNLHNVDAYLVLGAVVLSTLAHQDKDGSSEDLFNNGIQFQKLSANDRVILQSYIYQQMIEQPHSLT